MRAQGRRTARTARTAKAALTGVALTLGLTLGVVMVPVAANAVPDFDTVVSADPVDHTPHARDGRVRALTTVNGVTVAVGDFTAVRDEGSSTWIEQKYIVAFDTETGRILRDFDPQVAGSNVFDVVPAPDGESVIVGGLFRNIDDVRRTRRVAQIAVPSGEVVTSFRSPNFNSKVTELDVHGDDLYAGGWFTRSGGQPRTLVAKLDATTGELSDDLDLTFTGTFNGGTRGVADMTLRPDGSKLVVIGNWTEVEGQSRPQIAMIDLTTPTATLDSWATERYGTRCSRSFETYMWGVSTSPDGEYFAIGTTGAYSGGPDAGTLCDAVARWEFDRSGPGQQPTWVSYTGGDTVTQVMATKAAIYMGGHFRWMNNPWGIDRAGPGAVRRMGLAALDPRNGMPMRWNPTRKRGWGVWGFAADEHGLWVGHDTSTMGKETHDRLGLFPLTSRTSPNDNTGVLPANVYLGGMPSGGGFDDDLRSVGFDGSQATGTADPEDFDVDWSRTRAAFMVDRKLYRFLSNGLMTHQNFTENALGPRGRVQLNGLTDFEAEIASMTSSWYDAESGRLYYTLEGDPELYYRYFLTWGKLVGAQRFEADTHGMSFASVTGGFVVDDVLYYRDSSGTLLRRAWDDGPAAGSTPTAVSGPSEDGVDWRSRSMFLFADR